MINILILILCCLTKMSVGEDYCATDQYNKNICYDGGCNSPESENISKPCMCDFSKNVMNGRYCGVYDDKCLTNPCKNNGKCQSVVGHHVCECTEKFYGVNCEIPIKNGDKSIKIKRPSIFYRIKYETGSEMFILLVSDTFGDGSYKVIVRSVFDFTFKFNDYKKQNVEVSKLVKMCTRRFGSVLFKSNRCRGPDNADCQDMCDLISKLYGENNKVEMAIIGPFFNPKTFIGNVEEIFFDENRKKRMGMKFVLELHLISTDENEDKYIFPFIQFIADDMDSICEPFINEIEYVKNEAGQNRSTKELISESSPIKINKNEDWLLIIPYEFEKACNKKIDEMRPLDELFKLFIFKTNTPVGSFKNEINVVPKRFKSMKFDNHKLFINNHELPKAGIYIFFFSYTRRKFPPDMLDDKMLTHYMRYVEYSELIRLIAKIVGDSPIRLKNDENTLTLDASESYNPNEIASKQKNDLLFLWECNIVADDGCKKFSTAESTRTLKLTEDDEYTFTLTVSMNQRYITSVGKPPEGIASIVVIPYIVTTTEATTSTKTTTKKTTSSTKLTTSTKTSTSAITTTSTKTTLSLKSTTLTKTTLSSKATTSKKPSTPTIKLICIMNCKPLLNPIINLYLETKGNFIGNEFKWYYQQSDDINMISVDNIALTDVPTNLLVVKKNTLEYGTKYSFIVKYPKYELTESITVTTVGRPALSGCTIQPQSGVAGKTLFNISCTHFASENNTKHVFEYYQKNKNDVAYRSNSYGATNGVLLHRGNEIMTNVKLSCSKHLTVRILNKYGIMADVNLLVDISECNHDFLSSLFKELKTTMTNKDKSRAITIIAILSDTLRDYRIDQFHKLFTALNQIPIVNCISRTYQFSLILRKVINDYFSTTKSKMITDELISKHLFRISDSLHSFVKTHECDDRWAETQEIDKIKEILRNILAPLQNSLFQFNKDNDPDRYYRSSIDSMKLVTRNIDKLLTSFGKNIILDLGTYERPISCADYDENYDFDTCIVSAEWIEKRSQMESKTFMCDTVGEAMASELLSRGGDWGVSIFKINNSLERTFDDFGEIKVILPIVSLAVSNFVPSNPRNLSRNEQFENYFDLHFKTEDTVQRQLKNHTIQILAPDSNGLEFDKIIFVRRIDMENIGELFVTMSELTHDLRFVWLRDRRPDSEIMKDDSYAHMLTAGEKYELKLKTLGNHRNEIHYIGISVDTNEQRGQSNVFNVNFAMDIFSSQCLYWTGTKWAADGIIIGPNSTENDIHCRTNHASMFTGLLLTLPNVENPFLEIEHIDEIANNVVCISATLAVFFVYVILLVWSRYQDNKDVSRGKIIILTDNYPGEDEVYYVTVYTGNMHEAGTTANVCLRLHGNVNASRAHWLNDNRSDVLQRFHDDKFIIFTPQTLGDLEYVHVWHDSHGNHPNWYCKRIEVTDVRNEKTWYFEVERWFSLLQGIGNTEHVILAESRRKRKTRFTDEVVLNIREEHLWTSVFIRHPRSITTRCQRISNILCGQLSIMLTNLLFYHYQQDDSEVFIKLEITMTQIWIALFSILIEELMMFLTSYFFNKSTKLQENIDAENKEREDDDDDEKFKKTWWKKLLSLVTQEKLYSHAQTEISLKTNKGKKDLIIGWMICIGVYIVTSFFIILYGLKFGKVKSLHWITTIVIGVLQSTLLAEPLCIAISSLVWWLISKQEQNKINYYQIKLEKFRTNSKYLLNDFLLIQRIREDRYRYIYSPMTAEEAQNLQNKQRIKLRSTHLQQNVANCLLLILLSLCCRSVLYNTYTFFTPEIIRTNHINEEFLENLVKWNITDLETIKTFLSESLIPELLVKEYYNGISLIAKHSNIVRGRVSLYGSTLINGGIRLTQNRIRRDDLGWEDDSGTYTEGWIQTDANDRPTAWTFRSIPVLKYFNLWSPVRITSGFVLDLTGDLLECKNSLSSHLESGWLDERMTSLSIEFQAFTPVADCITVFKIRFEISSGSLYAVNREVWSVPSSSAFVSLSTHVFTLVSVSAYAAAAVWLTTVWLTSPAWADQAVGASRRFWIAYERTLVALVVFTAFVLAGRRQLMMVAGDRYESVRETAYAAGVTDTCHAHDHANVLVTAIGCAAALRAFEMAWSSVLFVV